jgi:tetratricopeptide (TPR) repeat protein
LSKLLIISLAFSLSAFAAWPAPPQNPPQRELTVVVVDAHTDPSQPVPGVRVSLSFIAGTEKVVDARDATNRLGQALLLVSPEAAQRGDLRIEITGVNDLVVYEPADGQLNGLPITETIRLLPKGSFLLLGPPQIEAMLQRMSIQNRAKNQEIRALKEELASARSQNPDDLAAAMTEWARANGFEIADVDKQVQKWAEGIQQRKERATAEQKALAELALKHYGTAAPMFDEVGKDRLSAFKENQQRKHEEERREFQGAVDSEYQSANAYRMNLQYHQATQVLEGIRDVTADQHRMSPEDAAYRSIWLETVLRLANARRDEGESGEAGNSSALLTQSIGDYRGLLQERSAPAERQDWAMTETDLGSALIGQGERSSGPQATDLLAQGVQAYRAALETYTKADQPKQWARTQNNLGNALLGQGERGTGTHATDLFAQAVRAYRAALEVRTKADLPQGWAATQSNLGIALGDQGKRSSGAEATKLLAQAVEAYRAALEVQTKADLPQGWAATQSNLGTALGDQGKRSSGAEATKLLAQAVEAYRAALEVQTKADLPQDWARTQNNLGNALRDQGESSTGPQVKELLIQAVQAYLAALEVRSKANLPQAWASTQNSLGIVLVDAAERSTQPHAITALAMAVKAFRAALEVQTKAELPQVWATTQNNLATALTDQGVRSSGAQATELLAQAVEAYRAVLEVRTKGDLPQVWAATQNNLGIALWDQGVRSNGEQAKDLLSQAVLAFRAALEVRTKSDLPQDWAVTQNNLGLALRDQAQRSTGAQAKELLAQAVDAYKAALEVYTRADPPQDWAITQNNLGNALVNEGDFAGAAKAFESCLEAAPDSVETLQTLASIYHDNFYRYDQAYELTERWIKLDDSPIARLSLVEEDLTTGRFEECEKQAATVDDAAFSAPAKLIRDSMLLTCQWGAGQKAAAQQFAIALSPKSAQLQKTGWEFAGTLHFLDSAPAFETGRASWMALFQSLERGDGTAMAASLHQLEDLMQH